MSKLPSGTSKTKEGALFWKWQLAYQYVILYHVTGSCKGPIMVIVTTEGITVMEIAITFGDKDSYLGRESYLLLLSFLRKKRP